MIVSLAAAAHLAVITAVPTSPPAVVQRGVLLDQGWKFHRGDAPGGGSAPVPSFAAAGFADAGWRTVEVPHDWSIEDLPAREDDFDVPAITIRNGTWKFAKGDDAGWSATKFDDAKWAAVTVPFDWRDPPTSYEDVNATGWFRRHFTLTATALAAYGSAPSPVRLAVGEAACSSTIYVNGAEVTGSNGGGAFTCLAFQAPEVNVSQLVAGDNVVAVRVHSQGGKAGSVAPDGYPGGLCDAGALAKHGVSVATGADWSPPSPFDPARTFNGRSVGYVSHFHCSSPFSSVPTVAGHPRKPCLPAAASTASRDFSDRAALKFATERRRYRLVPEDVQPHALPPGDGRTDKDRLRRRVHGRGFLAQRQAPGQSPVRLYVFPVRPHQAVEGRPEYHRRACPERG